MLNTEAEDYIHFLLRSSLRKYFTLTSRKNNGVRPECLNLTLCLKEIPMTALKETQRKLCIVTLFQKGNDNQNSFIMLSHV